MTLPTVTDTGERGSLAPNDRYHEPSWLRASRTRLPAYAVCADIPPQSKRASNSSTMRVAPRPSGGRFGNGGKFWQAFSAVSPRLTTKLHARRRPHEQMTGGRRNAFVQFLRTRQSFRRVLDPD